MNRIILKSKNLNTRLRGLRLRAAPVRHDDLYLVAFPKSGITWFSALLANVGLRLSGDTRRVTFFNLQDYVPDVHVTRKISETAVMPGLGFRIIKSHSEYNTHYKKVFYLVRDPRDVMISYWHFLSSLHIFEGNLSDVILNSIYGIDAWCRHVDSWMTNVQASVSINFFRFEDLKEKPIDILQHILSLWGFEDCHGIIGEALGETQVQKMRLSEKQYEAYNPTIPSEHTFVRKGESGGWREEMSDSDKEYILNKAGKYLDRFGYRSM